MTGEAVDSAAPSALLGFATRRALWLLAIAYFTMGMGSLMVIGLLEPMARDLRVPVVAIANLVTVFALTFALAAPLLQIVFGRLPRRSQLMAGLGVLAIGAFAAAATDDYWVMVATRIVMAIGAALVGPMASASGASLVPAAQQGRALGIVFGGLTLATVLGIPVAAWAGSHFGWQSVHVALGVLALLIALALSRWLDDRSRGQGLSWTVLGDALARRSTLVALAMTLLLMAAQFVTYALIARLLQQRLGASPAQVSTILFVFGLGGVVGSVLAARYTDALGVARIQMLALAGLLLSFLVLIVILAAPATATGDAMATATSGVPAAAAASAGWLPMVATVVVWAICGMLFMPAQQKRLIDLRPELRNVLLALNASALYLGMSAGSLVSGLVYLRWGPAALPAVSASLIGVTAVLLLVARAERRRVAAAAAGAVDTDPRCQSSS